MIDRLRCPSKKPRVLIAAGGTGGHIFPALAVAQSLRAKDWDIAWVGGLTPSMESILIPKHNFKFHAINFSGVRGKKINTLLKLPFRLFFAFKQCLQIIDQTQPNIILTFGGYISVPIGLAAKYRKLPLIIHEQNSVAGSANRLLANFAIQIFTAFPNVLQNKKAAHIGNPLRIEFTQYPPPQERFLNRQSTLHILVIGGSLGAQILNEIIPKAFSLLDIKDRPIVLHQGGQKNMDSLKATYSACNVQATLVPFIENTAEAYAQADLVICRAGASTVMELCAIGAAALFVPLPNAIDNHQQINAEFMQSAHAAWILPQTQLTPQTLADFLTHLDRKTLQEKAEKAYALRQTQAVSVLTDNCEDIYKNMTLTNKKTFSSPSKEISL